MFNFFKKKNDDSISIKAVADGKIISISDVKDPVFAQKMMGDGIAILPTSSFICAPIDGTIQLIHDTKHAFGMINDAGLEILVHIGLDTVNLKGEGFKALAKAGDSVKAGTPIIEIDLAFLNEKGMDITTPIVLLNHSQFKLEFQQANQAKAGETLLIKATKA